MDIKDTKKIILERTTEDEYGRIAKFWELNTPGCNMPKIPCKLLNPITFGSFEEAIASFLEFPYADMISVFNGSKWQKQYTRLLKAWQIDYISECAKRDRHKAGALEFYFKINHEDRLRGQMRLAPYAGKIMMYSITVPKNLLDVVTTVNVAEKDRDVAGIWNPENIARFTDILDRKIMH